MPNIIINIHFKYMFIYTCIYISFHYVSSIIKEFELGPVHTETFSCVFVLFTVLKGIENNQLIT